MNNPDDKVAARLRAAVNAVDAPPFLEAKIRNHIQADGSRPPRRWALFATAGLFTTLTIGSSIAYRRGHLRFTAASQEAYVASLSAKVAPLMHVGLANHLHCAVFQSIPDLPPNQAASLKEFEADLGPKYKALIPILQRTVPTEFALVQGHQCTDNGRDFVHLSFKNASQLLSLLITARVNGESFQAAGLMPARLQSGSSIFATGVDRFQVAAMETEQHLLYCISDLPTQQNTDLLGAMAPAIGQLLKDSPA